MSFIKNHIKLHLLYVAQYDKSQICIQGVNNLYNTQQTVSLDP